MKYFKPRSVTWWSGFIPLVAGIFVASEPMHGLTGVVDFINAVTGHMEPAQLITYGATAIGIRASV